MCGLAIELERGDAIIDIADKTGQAVAFAVKQAIACGVAAFERGAELLGLGKALFPCLPRRFGLLGGQDAQSQRAHRIEDRPRKRGLLVIKDTAELSGGVLGDRA